MATTKITSPDLFDLGSLNTALKLPSGTTAQRPTSPSTGEWRYNTTTNLVEFWDGGEWRDLQSENIPPTPSENFNVVLYNGNGTSQSITGVGFKPDFVWIKHRDGTGWHSLFDSTRGVGEKLSTNSANAENFDIQRLSSFDADGFTLGYDGDVNGSGKEFVAYCWKANGGTTSSNTDGTITSTVQANTKAGFSVVTYTGTGANATVGHGLGAQPYLVITKGLDLVVGTTNWRVYTNALGGTKNLKLNGTDAAATANSTWNDTDPTSSVFSLGTSGDPNGNGATYVAYCFAEVAEFSKFGSYTGNGTTLVVNTGFQPKWILIKGTVGNDNWRLYDTTRGINAGFLEPNNSDSENTADAPNFLILSNGFEITSGGTAVGNNVNGNLYTYYAFAADASSTAPVLANSFTTNLYTGNSGTQILGTGFQPSLVWIKDRSATRDHNLTDSIRGVTHPIYITTGAQLTNSTFLTSFNTDGFSLGNQAASNENLEDFVAWSWKANSIPSINTDGTNQSVVSANQANGFSIVQGTASGGLNTVNSFGHGLGVKPDLIIIKSTSSVDNWYVYNSISGAGKSLYLNDSAAEFSTTNVWANTEPTASVFSIKDGQTVSVGATLIAYCFASISGFSKMGTYTGSGSGSTQSVNTGFAASWVMIKDYNVGGSWWIEDTARGGALSLKANTNNAESTTNYVTFTSTGFDVTGGLNDSASGSKFIYIAFKENRGFASTGTMAFTVAAGGGGGGASQGTGTQFQRTGCGGGAGGFRGSGDITGGRCAPQDNINLASGTYTVTVGAGGSPRVSGSSSSIAGPSLTTISTVGGGRGADDNNQPENGGSGGGRSYYSSANGYSTACEGYGRTLEGVTTWQGGGGGAGGIQESLTASLKSGIGVSSAMSGTNQFYAGGGAPGSGNTTRPQAAPGGGGNGQISGETAANTPAEITGTANTGGGGGGGSQNTSTAAKGDGGSGGSGIVILRLKTSEYSGTTTGSPTVTTDGDETIMQFTGSGTYVHS